MGQVVVRKDTVCALCARKFLTTPTWCTREKCSSTSEIPGRRDLRHGVILVARTNSQDRLTGLNFAT